jgi:hypothetical protein
MLYNDVKWLIVCLVFCFLQKFLFCGSVCVCVCVRVRARVFADYTHTDTYRPPEHK